MFKILKNPRLWTVPIVIIVVLVYLFWVDFQPVKKIIGYNVPPQKLPPAVDFLNASEGFNVSVFAKDLNGPRVIVFDPKGRMLVSEPKEGRVLVLEDKDQDGVADGQKVILDGLRLPHGLDFYTDDQTKVVYLYVAETHQVARYVYNLKSGVIDEAQKTAPQNIANLPADGRHFTRTIEFGPNYRTQAIIPGYRESETLADQKLYISVGSSCDVCEENTWKRAAILESDPAGTYTAEFAGGLRNSVFFTFHPVTKELWATDMGRDNLGDELPPDEINIIKVAGPEHKFGARRFGWPFCYGSQVADKTFKPDKVERIDIPTDCSQTESPIIKIPAHSAPLGLAFIDSDKWPEEWQNHLLVAYHGSLNRSEPRGYKVVRFELDKNGLPSEVLAKEGEDFITGFYDGKNTLGRPVDLKFSPDGDILYVSDDSAGIIYRVAPTDN